MKLIDQFLKLFDKQLIELTIINSVIFAILIFNVFDISLLKAFILAPFAFIAFVLLLIAAAHIISAIMSVFNKHH